MNWALADAVLTVLSSPEPNRAALRLARFGERDWRRNLFWLDASGLALHLFDALRGCGAEDKLPKEISRRLQQNSQDNTARTRAMLEEFAEVNRALETAGVRFAALKGFTLVPEYCAHPALRLQLDLDYLVAREDMNAVAAAVRPLGYAWVSASPFESRFVTEPSALRHHDDLYKPPVSKALEFHFRLFDRPEFTLRLPDDPLQRSHAAMCSGVPTPVLDAEDQFAHQALHAFQHVLVFNMRLSWLLEIATAVRSRPRQTFFWEGLRERTKSWDPRIRPILGLVLALTRDIFACDIPPALREWTIEVCPPAIGVWVREYGRRWALRAFPGNKLTLLVTRELMDRRSWRAFARASLIPVRRPPRVATAEVPNGCKEQASRMQRRFVAQRTVYHLREALRLALAWPKWIWRRRLVSG